MPVTSAAKLASHIWRGAAQSAANAAHNSANTFRGAFQGASSGSASSTGSSASGWASGLAGGGASSAGAGAGGAKFHAGRGAHFSYQNTGRALSQASAISSPDAKDKSNDDEDEIRRYKAYKLRLDAQQQQYDRFLLTSPAHLTNSHMQVRLRSAFAGKKRPLLVTATEHNPNTHQDASQARRHASTSASVADATDVEKQQSPAAVPAGQPAERLYYDLRLAGMRKDAHQVRLNVDAFKALPKEHKTLAGFNQVMESLYYVRKSGQPVQEITDTYNDMINAGLAPNNRTYAVLIKALCARDGETYVPTIAHTAAASPAKDGTASAAAETDGAAAAAEPASEDNFKQAVELMQVAHSSHLWFPDQYAYNALLNSCALRGDVDRALSVLDLLERSHYANTDAFTFKNLIKTFVADPNLRPGETEQMQQARKLAACKQVFDEFLVASKNPDWNHDADAVAWHALLNAHFALNDPSGAVKLFETMLEGGQDVPPLSTKFISEMISGFLNLDDVTTALQWFAKVSPLALDGTRAPVTTLPRPHTLVIEQLISTLVKSGEQYLVTLQTVYHVYLQRCAEINVKANLSSLSQVISANVAVAQRHLEAGAVEEVNTLFDRALEAAGAFFAQEAARFTTIHLIENVDQVRPAVSSIFSLTDGLLTANRPVDAGSALTYAGIFVEHLDLTVEPYHAIAQHLSQLGSRFLTLDNPDLAPIRLFATAEYVGPVLRAADLLDEQVAAGIAALYRSVHAHSPDAIVSLPLSADAWNLILEAFCFEELNVRPLSLEAFISDGILMPLRDLAKLPAADGADAEVASVRPAIDTSKAVEVTVSRYGNETLSLLPEWAVQSASTAQQEVKEESASDADSASQLDASTPATTPPQQHSPLHRQDLPAPTFAPGSEISHVFPPVQVVDTDFGKELLALARPAGQHEAPRVYTLVREQIKLGNYAHPEGLAVLIGSFGRLGQVERVEELYAMAQHVLHALAGDPKWQTNGWFAVEDAMIQALSHSGHPEAATTHRHRMIAAGGAPTSFAYAALIAHIRDTTDDASIAQELFDESQRFGIQPTAYLFNTVISKLSRARKADRALQLFDEMVFNLRIKPTSVTYGAIINACTRIGDEQRAVQLFERMERDPTFQPRVPPYNTMMQFFVQSVPDREKALVYYRKMIAARVEPSAHTYKLLLDMYGAIEPVQPQEMERIFDEIVANPKVLMQGTHWASLINCYGCMLNDLDRAIATFDSIALHRTTQHGVPDAVAFEALLAVFVAHNRTDLMRPHLEKMRQAGIQMTAYVANLLIQGFSMEQGEQGLNEARALFESMSEPAAGIAAAGNHPPRAHGAGAPVSAEASVESPSSLPASTGAAGAENPFASVQREPSTYEAMIRAELAHGHTQCAQELVNRMEARAFPPPLIIRARALVSDAAGAALMEATQEPSYPGRFTYGKTSPRLSHASVLHPMPMSGGSAMSVRHASTMAGTPAPSGASNPAPGPPKPNSPFTIFDRAVKTMQKERAAVRPSVSSQDAGHAFGGGATRGEPSRQTDYVRRAIAESLADRVQDIKRDFETIVELGAGPGFLRHYLDSKGSGTKKIIMCDTSEALLNRDRHLDSEFAFEIERRVVDEELLPFEEATLDCVVVSGGLHWTNDLPGALIQIRRALKPDGVLIAALCGGDTLFELRTSLQLAEQEREGGISPRISPMADTRDMASLLSRAGFTIPTVDVDEVQVGYPSMYELMHDLRDMGESNAVINRRPQLRRDTMLAAGAIYEALHGNQEVTEASGEAQGVPATFQLIFLIGWSPSPTQPKPLKRGSAKSSLKDALAGAEGDVQSKIEEEIKEKERQQWMKSMEDKTGKK